jgi:hypothetical protein
MEFRSTAKRLQSSYNRSLMLSSNLSLLPLGQSPHQTRKCSGTRSEVNTHHRLAQGRQLSCMIFGRPQSVRRRSNPAFARIRSAHAQINAGGDNLSDRMIGYAMTMALVRCCCEHTLSRTVVAQPLRADLLPSGCRDVMRSTSVEGRCKIKIGPAAPSAERRERNRCCYFSEKQGKGPSVCRA